jgi:hypothetical protein
VSGQHQEVVRTTLDLDPAVLLELRRRKRETGRSISQLASELIAGEMARTDVSGVRRLAWRRARMGARVNLGDKAALSRALDGD